MRHICCHPLCPEHRLMGNDQLAEEGWLRLKRMPRSHRSGAAGVVRPAQRFAELTTPALRATPPLRGGECAPPIRHRNYEKQYLGGELFFLFYRSTCPNCLVIVCSFRGGAY